MRRTAAATATSLGDASCGQADNMAVLCCDAMNRLLDHLYIAAMILLTAYSQLVMRWRVGLAGRLPASAAGKLHFVAALLLNPWVLSGIVATFLAGVSWMLALTKFELSYAYPFTGIVFVLILLLSAILFHDHVGVWRLVGTLVVMAGLTMIVKAS
jgi:multidrug transporter EmrE-like cation transporter